MKLGDSTRGTMNEVPSVIRGLHRVSGYPSTKRPVMTRNIWEGKQLNGTYAKLKIKDTELWDVIPAIMHPVQAALGKIHNLLTINQFFLACVLGWQPQNSCIEDTARQAQSLKENKKETRLFKTARVQKNKSRLLTVKKSKLTEDKPQRQAILKSLDHYERHSNNL